MGTVIVNLPAGSSLIVPMVGLLALVHGVRMSVSSTKDWWIAVDAGAPVGVVAADISTRVVLLHAFVAEPVRRRGVYSKLFAARQAHVDALGLPIRSVIVPESRGLFARAGFRHVRNRGRFLVMEKP